MSTSKKSAAAKAARSLLKPSVGAGRKPYVRVGMSKKRVIAGCLNPDLYDEQKRRAKEHLGPSAVL